MAKRQGLFVLFNQRPINIFWKEIFASWIQIDDEMLLYETQFFLVGYKQMKIPLNETQFFHEHIWHDSQITIDNKSFFFESFQIRN